MSRQLYIAVLLALTAPVHGADSPRLLYRIQTVAGNATFGDGGPAIAAQLGSIQGVAADRFGNLYLSDTDHHRVRKIDASGIVTTVAGIGTAGFSGDTGPAIAAQLNLPYGLAVDLAGVLYIADLDNNRVRSVSPDGIIDTYAGSGGQGSSGDGGQAKYAQLLTPRNLAVDSAGNLYISEFAGHRVRKVTPDGLISTAAGTGVAGFSDGGTATTSQLNFPAGLALDRLGNLYIADSQNERIRKLLPGGQLSTALGGTTDVPLLSPIAVAVDLAGNIFVADNSAQVHKYTYRTNSPNTWTVAAGSGSPGFYGDGGPAKDAQLTLPLELAEDLSGNLYIADQTRLRAVDNRGIIHTVAGDNYQHAVGDGGPAVNAELLSPSSLALDGSGNLYIADTGTQRVRRVSPTGTMATVAGTGVSLPGTDGKVASATPLFNPTGVTVDQFGSVLIAETGAHRIRQVSPDGRIWTVLGTGFPGTGSELMLPIQTQLRAPSGLCLSRTGTLYVVDTFNHRVLISVPGALVATAAGNGAPGAGGDGGMARVAQLTKPSACAVDSAGNLYIADTYNHRIRKVDVAGIISTVAGSGLRGADGDEAPAIAASLDTPRGVAADDNGNIYIADTGNNRIRLVTPDRVIHTIAGKGAAAFGGDDGPALAAALNTPWGLLLDGAGDLYIADSGNNRVRRLTPNGIVTPPLVPPPPPLSIVNAASLTLGPVAPGEVVSLFGMGLGPQTGVGALIDASGLLANQLAGAEVRFDGVPAPLFYAQANQINAQVPYTVAGNELTHIEVFYQGQSVAAATLPLVPAAPGIFPVAVNQDGTYNSEANPAPRGTYLTLYATGEGMTDGFNLTGMPAAAPYPQPNLPLTVTVASMSAQVVWYGSAPQLVGLLQVNLRIPGGFVPSGAVPLELTLGAAVSNALTIWVK